MVYASLSVSLALLETLAHLGREVPRNRFLVRVGAPDGVWARAIWPTEDKLPKTWRAEPAGLGSMKFGDEWLASGESALLCLPSVIVPEDINVLINPKHPDTASLNAEVTRQLLYDPRLLRI